MIRKTTLLTNCIHQLVHFDAIDDAIYCIWTDE